MLYTSHCCVVQTRVSAGIVDVNIACVSVNADEEAQRGRTLRACFARFFGKAVLAGMCVSNLVLRRSVTPRKCRDAGCQKYKTKGCKSLHNSFHRRLNREIFMTIGARRKLDKVVQYALTSGGV
jgi:hypothetical protein